MYTHLLASREAKRKGAGQLNMEKKSGGATKIKNKTKTNRKTKQKAKQKTKEKRSGSSSKKELKKTVS